MSPSLSSGSMIGHATTVSYPSGKSEDVLDMGTYASGKMCEAIPRGEAPVLK